MLNTLLGTLSSGAAAGTYESIASVTVGSGGIATIDFTSIPATYKHLQIRGIGRTNRADILDYYSVRFNSDTGSNYAWHQLYGSGSTAAAQAGATQTSIRSFRVAGGNDAANMFGAQIMDIVDYASTSKYKTFRSFGGLDTNSATANTTEVDLCSGLWQSTSAITSIQLLPGGGTLWAQDSTFALYGIKG